MAGDGASETRTGWVGQAAISELGLELLLEAPGFPYSVSQVPRAAVAEDHKW